MLAPILAFAITVGGDGPMSVICDMVEQPDERHDVTMKFELANYSGFAIDRVWIRIYEPDWEGFETDPPSIAQLDGAIPAHGTVVRTDSVKAPPGFRMLKFSSLTCTVQAVRFADGTQWQAAGNQNPL
ncbi:MAG TPA: hypothetical protein VGG89_05555 [Candidatus Baltobacteraceae bacterium]|jgi:hypothetical protein